MSLLSKDTLVDFKTWLRRAENGLHGRQRGDDAVRKIIETIEVFWTWAYERERWEMLPPKKLHLKRSKQQPPRAPTWENMDAAVNAADGWMKKLMTWLRYTGMRPTESMHVLWTDLDLDRATLTVRSDLIGNKTGIERTIPISAHLADELATWGTREGYVIPSGRSLRAREGTFRNADDIRRVWARSGAPLHVYRRQPDKAFRVGFKSGMLGLGADRDSVDYLQGHIDAGARARYVDGSQLPLRATADRIPRIGATNVVRLPARKEGHG